jgi:hypothetical protein
VDLRRAGRGVGCQHHRWMVPAEVTRDARLVGARLMAR